MRGTVLERSWRAVACLVALVLAAANVVAAADVPAPRTGPKVDHHQHLLSPDLAPVMEQAERGELAPVELPPEIADLVRRRQAAWNDAQALAPLYAERVLLVQHADSSMILQDETRSGRRAVADFVAVRFARPYVIAPLVYVDNGAVRQLAGTYDREGPERKHLGLAELTFAKDPGGAWVIAGETMKFPGPPIYGPVDANALVALLDQAGIDRAVVLSGAYLFASPYLPRIANADARLRAENDWTTAQVARHPDRLVGFCGVDPLVDGALPEIERCARDLHLRGLKLHFGNSQVDLANADQLRRVQRVFAAANGLSLPIVVHLAAGEPENGARDAEIFLTQVLPHAPDVVVQVAHLAGSGPGWNDEALEVLAAAVAKGDPRTKNLYFDVATVADLQKREGLELLAKRIREIGPTRILYGSDASFGGRHTPDEEWGTFRGMVPLTDAELAIIRDNVAPYLR
jgi:predicted TIM-barrel fold metal-dependent hydrolase